MNEKRKTLFCPLSLTLVCIVIGLLVGFIILYCINAENAVDGLHESSKAAFT